MIKAEFTDEHIRELRYERYDDDISVRCKTEAVFLKSHKLPHKKISEIAGISCRTLRKYLRDYIQGGIEKLKEDNSYKPESEMMRYREKPEAYFKTHPPANTKEAMAKESAEVRIVCVNF